MEKYILTREELYGLVWSKSISEIAKEFQIEPQRLKEICEENEIPLPSRGYWSKIRFNKKVEQTPLSKIENDVTGISLKTRKFRTDYQKRAFELEQQKELKFSPKNSL